MSNSILKSLDATKVEYRRLGRAGLKVSVPILGAMSFGDKRWMPWVLEEAESLPLLKAAYDKGLNTWDTANIYSNGESERIIGKALTKYDIPREKVILLSKCFATVGEDPGVPTLSYTQEIKKTKDYVNQGGLSRGAILNAVDKSLERLGTTYLDLLQIHRFDRDTPVEETMEALHDLVKSGKVRYIGASSMWTYQFAMMQFTAEKKGWTKFVSMQNHYNLLYREEEREMIKYCHETGVGLIPWAPLARGVLARPLAAHGSTDRSSGEKDGPKAFKNDNDRKIVERVEELAEKKGWAKSQVALAWILTKVSSPIVGFSKEERIDEAIGVRGKELSPEEIAYLEELYTPREIEGH